MLARVKSTNWPKVSVNTAFQQRSRSFYAKGVVLVRAS